MHNASTPEVMLYEALPAVLATILVLGIVFAIVKVCCCCSRSCECRRSRSFVTDKRHRER